MIAALFIFVLLASFNRTVNRLTKPVTAIIGLSLLSSAFISSFYFFNKIEGELLLSNYLNIFEELNLVMHFNLLSEKIMILFSLFMSFIIGFSFYKLPRRKGYVSFMIIIGLISSSVMFSILLVDLSALI